VSPWARSFAVDRIARVPRRPALLLAGLLIACSPARALGAAQASTGPADLANALALSRSAAESLDFVQALNSLSGFTGPSAGEQAWLDLERARLLHRCGDYQGCLEAAWRCSGKPEAAMEARLEAAWWGSNAALWIGHAPLARLALDRLGELLDSARAAAPAMLPSSSEAPPDLAPWISAHGQYSQQVEALEAGHRANQHSLTRARQLVWWAAGVAITLGLLVVFGFGGLSGRKMATGNR
jgi:hypothetical protein